jgi:hypothetical protein
MLLVTNYNILNLHVTSYYVHYLYVSTRLLVIMLPICDTLVVNNLIC